MNEPRTTCRECGAELWGSDEAHGMCGLCAERENIETCAYDPPPTEGEEDTEDE